MSATGISLDVARELRAICGQGHVVETSPEPVRYSPQDTVDLAEFGLDAPPPPPVDVTPNSAEEVAAVLRVANEHGLCVYPSGGGTAFRAAQARSDVILHTNHLAQVEHYDHADLTVGVGAGMTVAQLNAMVGADKLMFGGDPPLPEYCTVGGLLATAGHGPLRHGYGGVRDYCIGVRFVTGDGRRAKGGGRVVKNVAGYDLMKLLIGSYGTLAVITSASFKLFPAPRQTRTFLAEFATVAEALQFRDTVMRSPLSPMCLEIVSPGARKLMRPDMDSDAWVICVRAAGSDTVLARYRRELGSAVTRELDGEDESRMWRMIEDFPVPNEIKENVSLAKLISEFPRVNVTVPLNRVADAIEAVNEYAVPGWMGVGLVGRIGVGHILATNWPEDVETCIHPDEFGEFLRNHLREVGNLTVSGSASPWCGEPSNLASMRAVKKALDPNNILRGRDIS